MPQFDRTHDHPFWQEYAPEGAVPVGFMACIQWISPETGQSEFRWVNDSDELITACIGQLEKQKADLLAELNE